MKFRILAICLLFATIASAKDHDYQKATLLRVDSAACSGHVQDSKTASSQLPAVPQTSSATSADSAQTKSQTLVCLEYILQSDTTIYRLRPKRDKHPALLPAAELAKFRITYAQFRLEKNKLFLRIPELDDKEREYSVVSASPRLEVSPTQSASKD
jgi:hypothetical protein